MGKQVWVFTERKVVEYDEPIPGKQYEFPTTRRVRKVFDVGDKAPAGFEGRPFTRLIGEEAGNAVPVEDKEREEKWREEVAAPRRRGRPRKGGE